MDIAKREGNLAKAGELSYGVIPELEKKLEEAEGREEGGMMVEEAVRPEQIAAVVERWTGIPTSKMLEGEREKLLHMEDELGKRVIGQRAAVTAVSNAVRRARAGLQDENRPLGSFLFLGPTGVGKTELTKALAEFMFDDEHAMVRMDMSEYMEKHAVARLIGARTMFIDSIANANELSLSAHLAKRHADRLVTQWPSVAEKTGANFIGSVL